MNRGSSLSRLATILFGVATSIGFASPSSAQQPANVSQQGTPILLPGAGLSIWDSVDGALVLMRIARRPGAPGEQGDLPDLREGDRLVSIQGEVVDGGPAFFATYRGIAAGDTVRLVVDRGGEEINVSFESPGAAMVIGQLGGDGPMVAPAGAPSGWTPSEESEFQGAVRIAGYELAQADGGVEVLLELSDPANDGIDLRPGDLIVEAAGRPVGSPHELRDLWESLRPEASLELSVARDGQRVTVFIRR